MRTGGPGQYVLTGSSDIFTTAAAYDSLAGRVMTLTLRPFSTAEITGKGPCLLLDAVSGHPADCLDRLPTPNALTRVQAIDLIVRGGFPEIRSLNDSDRIDRYRSYLDCAAIVDVLVVQRN